ncbi:MAG: ABC transporter substrate-binding protein, partial [Endomicrobiia bacterium]
MKFKNFVIFCIFIFLFSCGTKKSKQEIVIWHWMTDREEVFSKLAQQYSNSKGITVKFETYAPSDVYREKVRAAAQGGLLPDIYSPLGDQRELASFIKAGYVEDLTEYMNTGWKDVFFDTVLQQNTYKDGNEWDVKPGIYGVPIDVVSIQIFYNKSLFEKLNLSVPKTFDEFINVCRKLRANNIQPFVSGFGEEWLVDVFSKSFEYQILGEEGMIKTIKGEIKYTDPRWIGVFELFEKMRDEKIFAEGIITMINKDAERVFATEKSAMALNGSWGINVYSGMNPELKYDVFMPPKIANAKYPVKIWVSSSFLNVNPKSKFKQQAVEFLKWLTEE